MNIIVSIINALGQFSDKYIHVALSALEAYVIKSTTPVDNAVFYRIVAAIQSWKPKNFSK